MNSWRYREIEGTHHVTRPVSCAKKSAHKREVGALVHAEDAKKFNTSVQPIMPTDFASFMGYPGRPTKLLGIRIQGDIVRANTKPSPRGPFHARKRQHAQQNVSTLRSCERCRMSILCPLTDFMMYLSSKYVKQG